MGAKLSWGTTAAVAILTGLTGAVAAACLAYWCMEWYRLRTHEGGELGYFILCAPLGFVCGCIIAVVVARNVPGFWAAQGLSFGVVLALMAAIGFVARMYGEVAPELEGDKLLLQVELKYPPGWEPDPEPIRRGRTHCDLVPIGPGHRVGKRIAGNLLWNEAKDVDGRWVVPCEVMLLSSREVRLVSVILGKSMVDFSLKIAPKPTESDKQWSEWIQEGFAWETVTAPPAGYAYRRRVQRIGEMRDREAAKASAFWEERGKMAAAIPADAPIEQWLPLFEDPDGTPASYRWGGAERVERKAVAARLLELGPLLRSSDRRVMRQAVFALGSLQETPESLVDPLLAAGRLVPVLIKEARAVPVTELNGDADRQKAETRALQYFGMWENSMNNAPAAARGQFQTVLEDIQHEAEASHSTADVAIIAYKARDDVEKLARPAGAR